MDRRQCALCLSLLLRISVIHTSYGAPAAGLDATLTVKPSSGAIKQRLGTVVVTENEVIGEENTTQKVIRINPRELPAITHNSSKNMDSLLYNIHTLLPPQRSYVNSNRIRPAKVRASAEVAPSAKREPIIIKQLMEPKFRKPLHNNKKQLSFLYNQNIVDNGELSKTMRVHLAPGAYPVYYVVAKANGRFGKYPVKGFHTPEEFLKYLVKSKISSVERAQRLQS